MAIDSFSALKDSIIAHLDRDDLTDYVEDFISLAEERHRSEIRIREMIARAQADVNTRFLALPDGFLEMQALHLLTDPVTPLTEVSMYELARQREDSSGTPRFYTVHEEIEFDRAPSSTETAEMIYTAKLTPLSDDNTSNALLERAPSLYLYGALVAAEPFLANDERIQTWSQLYASARESLNVVDRRRAGPLVARVVGATP